MHLTHIVGARPNFVKLAPVHDALEDHPSITQEVVHTGQHYDEEMSDVFFDQLGLPEPHRNLGVGSDTHARQTADVMVRLEEAFREDDPDRVLVYGDVNSTAAAALVASKMGIPLDHVEAGLRSFDRSMPEEINRIVTDRLAHRLFTHSAEADEHLRDEGADPDRIHRVGNVMIDTLEELRPRAEELWPEVREELDLDGDYLVLTLHRPSNVDDPETLAAVLEAVTDVSREIPVVFPLHPRTQERIEGHGIDLDEGQVRATEPLGYLEFLSLEVHAEGVLTDSGGIQEETTALGVPCVTIREHTERPVTVRAGTNVLVGHDPEALRDEARRILDGEREGGQVPPLWDGEAASRIAKILAREV